MAEELGELERFDRENNICGRCENNCCLSHNCEFYAPEFKTCPVFAERPAVCRFHFCEKYRQYGGTTIRELSEIFLYSASAAAGNGSDNIRYFLPPPFNGIMPELIRAVIPLVEKVRCGEIKPAGGLDLIRREVIRYHKPAAP